MADVATSSNAELQSSPKTTIKKEKKKIDRPKTSHPTTAVMVNSAIQNLKERGGSSLQAIKKYISATYKIDGEKFAPFIKKYLKASVISGGLVQTKGKGASGSFKLASTAVTKKSVSTTTVVKPKKAPKSAATKSKPKVEKEVKIVSAKKSAVVKSVKSKKSTRTASPKVAKPKSPSKVKKTTKTPTKKPKSPKPKTTKPTVVKKRGAPKKR